jgi:hypothetical protein
MESERHIEAASARGGLASTERGAYAERGYFVRPALFAPAELEALRAAVERVHARVVEAATEGGAAVERIDGKRYQRLLGSTIKWEWREDALEIRSMEPFAHLDPALPPLLADPRLWRPVADLLGFERVSLFTDKLNFKRPRGAPFPWHQDSPYWAFGCAHVERLVSVQLYLDDATRDNGCLWMIPGSHRQGMLPTFSDRGVLGRLYTDLSRFEHARPEPVEAPAGSAIFFHGDVVHGSRTNRSRASRRAIVLTYQPPGLARWNETEGIDV